MSSKYYDTTSVLQVIGNVFNNPSLLEETDKYNIIEDDFDNDFHKIVFGSIYKLYILGAKTITIENIMDFLSTRPEAEAIFKANKGSEWVLRVSENAQKDAFDYYYDRMKKMSLLRSYNKILNMDLNFIYDPDNILDIKKKQIQEEWLDNSSLQDIANKIDEKIDKIKEQFVENNEFESVQAGVGARALVEELEKHPEVGVPMYGNLINTVTRGARLGKFYLRSLASGYGKSRTMIADICNIACDKIYDNDFGWIKNGRALPSLYIAVEQGIDEIQTMMLAFLSNVNEDHILYGKYEGDERQRVMEAAQLMENSPLYIEEMPDFSIQDVENSIKKNIRDNNVSYIGFDYILTSVKIMAEITRASGGVKIREDNVLFLLSAKLKELCIRYNVWIISSTQLNGQWKDEETPDQNLLRGSKAIADRIDLGMIGLPVNERDVEHITPILAKNPFEKPNLKWSVYKNRRGKYKGIYLWCDSDLGTCRVNPMFATDWNYNPIDMKNLVINIEDEQGAF